MQAESRNVHAAAQVLNLSAQFKQFFHICLLVAGLLARVHTSHNPVIVSEQAPLSLGAPGQGRDELVPVLGFKSLKLSLERASHVSRLPRPAEGSQSR